MDPVYRTDVRAHGPSVAARGEKTNPFSEPERKPMVKGIEGKGDQPPRWVASVPQFGITRPEWLESLLTRTSET